MAESTVSCVCGASLTTEDADLVREFQERHDSCAMRERVNRVVRAYARRR